MRLLLKQRAQFASLVVRVAADLGYGRSGNLTEDIRTAWRFFERHPKADDLVLYKMRRNRCRCGHVRPSHAMEYGKGGALCRVRECKCMDYRKVRSRVVAQP